jgi:hypothetical protein
MMDDAEWYYNYFKKFVDSPGPSSSTSKPAVQSSSPALSTAASVTEPEVPTGVTEQREEEVPDATSKGVPSIPDHSPLGVVREAGETDGTVFPDHVNTRERVLFGKAPRVILDQVKRVGKKRGAASVDSDLDVDGTDSDPGRKLRKVKKRVRLTDVYPALVRFK